MAAAALFSALFLILFFISNFNFAQAGNSISVVRGHQPLYVGWNVFGGYGTNDECAPSTNAEPDLRNAWMTNGGATLFGNISLPKPTLVASSFFTCTHVSGASDTANLAVTDCTGGRVWDATSKTCINPPSGPDLIPQNLNVPASATSSSNITVTANARNQGTSATGVGFSNKFRYQWNSTSGAWQEFSPIATFAKAALAASTSASIDSKTFSFPGTTGTLYIEYCVDTTNAVNEGSQESGNCAISGGIIVSAPALPQCSDGLDNDGDGQIDHPNDPGCSSPTDDDETNTAQADLISSNVSVSGTLKQANIITLNARVTNNGTVGTGIGFSDNFTYRIGTSGGWNAFTGNTVAKSALAPAGFSPDSVSLNLSGISGQLYIQHCVDAVPAAGVINEGVTGELNNCSVGGPYTVVPTQCNDGSDNDSQQGTDMSDPDCANPDDDNESGSGGSCTGSVPSNANLCSGDDTGVTGTVTRTAVSSCTVATKCEYQCSAGFMFSSSAGRCISGSLTVNPGTITSGLTTDVSWTTNNASSCTVSSSPSAGSWTGTSGSPRASNAMTANTTFTLVCDGVPLDAETVVVDAVAEPTLNATPRVVPPNTDVTLTWDTNNTDETSCTLTGGNIITNPLTVSGGDPEQGSYVVTITRTTTFTLNCANGTDTVTITVIGSGFET